MIQEAYIQGVSTRSVDDLVKAMGMSGISKSQVSRLCEEIDARAQTFLARPIEVTSGADSSTQAKIPALCSISLAPCRSGPRAAT